MIKDHLNGRLHDNTEEVLEISSTGYGLESVVKEQDDEDRSSKKKEDSPNCGGL